MLRICLLPNKEIRAAVIKNYYGDQRLYCFSSGNATKALKEAGANVISIDHDSPIVASRFVDWHEADHIFNAINVTSGCLPGHLMEALAKSYFDFLEIDEGAKILVPVGSGETLIALSYYFKVQGYTGTDECIKLEMTPLEKMIRQNFTIFDTGLPYREAVLHLAKENAENEAIIYNPFGTGGIIEI